MVTAGDLHLRYGSGVRPEANGERVPAANRRDGVLRYRASRVR